MGTKQSAGFNLIFLVSLIAIQNGCGGSSPAPPPPPPPTQYAHDITIATPLFMQDGTQAPGYYTVKMNGQTYTGTFDQKLTLPKTTKKIELCEVILYPTGGLQRTYRTGEITEGTQLAPNVIRLPFPIQSYISNISPTGQNPMWANRDVNTTWNPNQGLILDQIYRQAIMSVIFDPANPLSPNTFKMWSWVPNWPSNDQYFLRNITYADGNHPYDPSVPANGDIWVFPDTSMMGTSHVCYPLDAIYVVAFKLFINPSASPGQAANETQVSFPNRQGIAGHTDLSVWSMLMFNRPNTPDYTIGLAGEVQDGFDARSTNTPSTSTSMLGSAVNLKKISEINSGIEGDKEPTEPLPLIQKLTISPLHKNYIIPGRLSSPETGDTKKTTRID